MDHRGFHNQARRLVGKKVEVITVHGTFRGTLLSVGSNFITMRTRIRGRIVRILIRLALIVALFRLLGVIGGPSVSIDGDAHYPIYGNDSSDDHQ